MKKVIALLLVFVSVFSVIGCGGSTKNKGIKLAQYELEQTDREIGADELRDRVLGGIVGHAIGLGTGWEFNVIKGLGSEGEWTDNTPSWGDFISRYQSVNEIGPWIAMPNELFTWVGGSIGSERKDYIHDEGTVGYGRDAIFPIEEWRVTKGYVRVDDDLFIDYLNEYIFEIYGPNISSQQLLDAWKNFDIKDVGGGAGAMNVITQSDYAPPFSGRNEYGNPWYWCTESWIENDLLGINFPGMPITADYYANMFGQVQGTSDTLEMARVLSIAGSLMYLVDEDYTFQDAFYDALLSRGKGTRMWEAYELVVKNYNELLEKEKRGEATRDEYGLLDWRPTCVELYNNRINYAVTDNDQVPMNTLFGFICLGVVFGENDFTKTMIPVALAGLDGDCTAASIGGLLGIAYGYSGMPEEVREFLDEESIYENAIGNFCFVQNNYPRTETLGDLADRTYNNAVAQIEANGGKVENNVATIKCETPHVQTISLENYQIENGTDGWLYTGDGGNIGLVEQTSAHSGACALSIESETKERLYQKVSGLTVGHTYAFSFYYTTSLEDTKVRIFAKDDKNYVYKDYIDSIRSQGKYSKAELVFVATNATMEVGLETADAKYSYITCDDFEIDDVQMFSKGNGTVYEAETADFVPGDISDATKEEMLCEDTNASGGKYVKLKSSDSITFNIKNDANNVLKVRVYYKNPSLELAAAGLSIAGITQSVVPFAANTSDATFNDGAFVEFDIAITTPGNYALTLTNNYYETIEIDKIEVYSSILARV